MSRIFDAPIHSSERSFDRVLAAGLPLMVVYCGRDLAPDLEPRVLRLAREYAGRALLVRLRADENPRLVGEHGVGGVPWVVTLRQGKVLASRAVRSPAELDAFLAHLVGIGPLPSEPAPVSPSRAAVRDVQREPLAVSDATFERNVLHSPLPVLVDFWAPWCAPCRMVAPAVERLAREQSQRLRVAKVNVDENPVTAGQLSVTGIPTMVLFSGGKVVDRWTGALPESSIRARLARWI